MSEGKIIKSGINPCGICGKRVTINSVLGTKCDQWIHGRCSKLRKITASAARFLVCSKREKVTNGAEVQQEVMCDEVQTVMGLCYLNDRLNASRGCEAAVIAKTRVGWKKFRECGEILFGKKFSLWIKEKIYKSYVRSAMLYGSETRCLRENKVTILRRAERYVTISN